MNSQERRSSLRIPPDHNGIVIEEHQEVNIITTFLLEQANRLRSKLKHKAEIHLSLGHYSLPFLAPGWNTYEARRIWGDRCGYVRHNVSVSLWATPGLHSWFNLGDSWRTTVEYHPDRVAVKLATQAYFLWTFYNLI